MDIKLQRPRTGCAESGREFVPGEAFYSALVRGAGSIDRVDVAAAAWRGAPEGTIAWWRSAYPAAGATGPVLAPPEVLLDALEALEDIAADEPLRYLLALQLVRRRVLRVVDDPPGTGSGDELVLACRKRDREYRVRAVAADATAAAEVQERLVALLWSGGDA